MSKIKIKSVLKSEDDYEFNGFGLKSGNKIIYMDHNIKTIVTLGEVIYLERQSDYHIKLAFAPNKILIGTYTNEYGSINLDVKTTRLKQNENKLEIYYTLLSDGQKISDFIFILKYSIDT